ncbi:MAG: hypothetical protein SAL07_13520 [Oscillatoria sp. PMC 1051.18]|uniref:ParB/RepB/Spo0J family partition protein n=1 Tax=Oscillatoria salina TaxID=331517 RepID=UPI0013BAC2B5|nr:hypothetical protein [Oscillatoria salina]MBZ8183072.1 hypothetical protein [Oscillatoria salina IIICB1]MEC4894160.1 hypothetical protein [Oscillatoria sp. PMC 1050.18]MEC5030912.1 hypothetical protein [Oscillatoria sp. PMC 1051.18]NET91274.1 hypothetical protein [Kamptonema sp. SIO1D9]
MKNRLEKNYQGTRDNVIPKQEIEVIEETFASLGLMGWRSFVQNRLPLLKLPDQILEALQKGQLEYTKARAIARVKDEAQRERLLSEAIAGDWSLSQKPTPVRVATLPSTLPLGGHLIIDSLPKD